MLYKRWFLNSSEICNFYAKTYPILRVYANFYATLLKKYASIWVQMTQQQKQQKLHKPSIYGLLKGFENLWKKR